MKRLMAMVSAAAMLLAASCGGGQGDALVGGYADMRKLTDEDKALFEKTTEGLEGFVYTPVSVSTQVVAGTNYRFLCKAREAKKSGKRFDAVITVFVPLPGQGEPRVTSVEREPR